MDSFHFLRPLWLLGLVPLLALLWLLWSQRLSSKAWRSVCDPELLPYVLIGEEGTARRWPLLVLGLGGILAILALAGPAWEQREQPVFRQQSALVIILDLSRSMEAQDIKPSRLTRARHKLIDILKQRREGQTALLVYAALPFVITPLTEDNETILAQVNSLETALMPAQGSRTDLAVAKAVELLKQAGHPQGNILLLTDGIGELDPEKILAPLQEGNYRLSLLGVGTEAGAPIPLPQGGFLKSPKGEIILPKLEPLILRDLASRGGGGFQFLTLDDQDIQQLLNPMDSRELDQQEDNPGITADQWQEEGPWLLLLILPLAALAFRRGYLAALLILLLPPPPAQALEWRELWSNQDQRAAKALEQGQAKEAAGMFSDPEWQATAHYRAGEYEQAIEKLEGIETSDALYNKGNALAQSQRLEEALAAYEQALELDPGNQDAEYNRELVKKQLEQQQQEQQQSDQQEQQDQDQEQEQQSNEESDQQQSGNQEQQEQSEQQQQDQQNQEQQQANQSSGESKQDQTNAEEEKQPEQQEESEASQSPQQEPGEEEPEEQEQQQAASTELEEQQQPMDPATEQWLKRVPDDPSGLLRRKFQYQYRNLGKKQPEQQPW